MIRTQDVRVAKITPLITPRELRKKLGASEEVLEQVIFFRQVIEDILLHKDDRMLLFVGPCSIRNPQETLYYAQQLASMLRMVRDVFFVVMRVYVEKPRTTIGWKGLINDPHLDGSHDLDFGLEQARRSVLEVAKLGLPIALEVLDPFNIRYLSDLVSWACIGARTVESPVHREIASGLSMPIGFKNHTEGSVKIAIDAIETARHPHTFRGIDDDGRISRIETKGNPLGHVVLRGGGGKTNYDAESIENSLTLLKSAGFSPAVVVDCSHGNSRKDYRNQAGVFASVIEQHAQGNKGIVGVMLESDIFEGKQEIPAQQEKLKFGISVTDACIGITETRQLIQHGGARLSRSSVYSI